MISFLTIFLSGSACLGQGVGAGLYGDNLAWILQDSTLTISGSGEMAQIGVSSSPPWDRLRTYIKKVIIQATVTKIAAYVFQELPNLFTIEFPNSVTEIGTRAFYKCDKLTSISALTDIKRFDVEAFSGCRSLQLPSIDFSGVELLESNAFFDCKGLKSIHLPLSSSALGSEVFAYSGVSEVSGGEGLMNIPAKLFEGCKDLTAINLPSTITAIRPGAFRESGIMSIDIPESVASIGDQAFYGSELSTIRLPSGLTTLGVSVFESSKLTAVTIPSGVTKIPKTAFVNCINLTSVDLPSGITEIENGAFSNCEKLSSITLPANLSKLAYAAFRWSGLESVHLPEKITQIEKEVFFECEKLAAIHVENTNSVYSSDEGILFDKAKTKLLKYPANKTGEEYSIPPTVNTIGPFAFDLSIHLKHLVIPENVLAIETFGPRGGFLKEDVTIETKNKIPLTLAANTFNYYDEIYYLPLPSTLVVPKGTATLYRNAYQWECFSKIVESSEDANEPVATVDRLLLYPNPVKDYLTIEHTDVQAGKSVAIYSMNGTEVARTTTDESVTCIDVSHLANGIYLIRIDGKYTVRFMKKE